MNEKLPMHVYGIPSCDTVKKARAWLVQHTVDHHFVDFKKMPPNSDQLAGWLEQIEWEQLVNRKGTTWRKLDAATQAMTRDASSAQALALAFPSVIKRPLVEWPNGQITVGFDAANWSLRCGLARSL